MKRGMIIACLIGFVAAVGARAADEPAAKPPENPSPGRGSMMDNLLPPPVLKDLALTADQKTQYGTLEGVFKREATKWRADNNYDPAKAREEMRKARDAGDDATMKKLADQRKGLMDLRKGYVDKLRNSLTEEQNAKLDKALVHGGGRGPRGGPNSDAKPPTPPPAPQLPPPTANN